MADMSAQGTLPVAGANMVAAPITDTAQHIMVTYNGQNADENNVDYTSSDGIMVLSKAQSVTGKKTFKSTAAAGAGVVEVLKVGLDPASGTVANNDGVRVTLFADDDGGSESALAYLDVVMSDKTAGAEVAKVKLLIADGSGSPVEIATLGSVDGLVVGADDTGYDVKLFGATSGKSWLWDESADKMIVTGDASVSGVTTLTGVVTVGGNIVSDTDSTDDLGTTSVRFANVYTDAIGDTGQALTLKATTLTGPATLTLGTTTTFDMGAVTTLDFDGDVAITGGNVTKANNSSFQAIPASNASNVTGDGTGYTVAFGTERWDIGSNFASNTYTASVTGKHMLGGSITLTSVGAGHTRFFLSVVTSNKTYTVASGNAANMSEATGNELAIPFSVSADMDANDTATVLLQVFNSTATVGVNTSSVFWGYLAQ